MTEMVVTVDTFIVHLFRKVCSACLVKSWKTVCGVYSFFFLMLTSNSIISYHICSEADGACLVTGLRMSFYWVRVEEIFLMKIRPSPFHSQFRAYCSHKVDPHLRLCARRLHVAINNSKLILIYNILYLNIIIRKLDEVKYIEILLAATMQLSDNDTNKKRESEKNSSFQFSISPNSCISMRRSAPNRTRLTICNLNSELEVYIKRNQYAYFPLLLVLNFEIDLNLNEFGEILKINATDVKLKLMGGWILVQEFKYVILERLI
ncbi:hypothetical protein T11_4611 [Trichinella zimbabwensis]|uniref:Uncharacterized protein n=1 Tax=Trichinella zimbabwensis TaxID=268475 RepID=A0A0V1I8G2_9BILA|nr:hypothetical protein T11_4611 [Trichinella zimbabwensis]